MLVVLRTHNLSTLAHDQLAFLHSLTNMDVKFTPSDDAGSLRFSKRVRDGLGEDYARWSTVLTSWTSAVAIMRKQVPEEFSKGMEVGSLELENRFGLGSS